MPNVIVFLIESSDIDRHAEPREKLAGAFPISQVSAEQQYTISPCNCFSQIVFAVESEREAAGLIREDGGAINQCLAKAKEMTKHQPPPLPPRHGAEHTPMIIDRGRHIRRDEREIKRWHHREGIREPEAQQ